MWKPTFTVIYVRIVQKFRYAYFFFLLWVSQAVFRLCLNNTNEHTKGRMPGKQDLACLKWLGAQGRPEPRTPYYMFRLVQLANWEKAVWFWGEKERYLLLPQSCRYSKRFTALTDSDSAMRSSVVFFFSWDNMNDLHIPGVWILIKRPGGADSIYNYTNFIPQTIQIQRSQVFSFRLVQFRIRLEFYIASFQGVSLVSSFRVPTKTDFVFKTSTSQEFPPLSDI